MFAHRSLIYQASLTFRFNIEINVYNRGISLAKMAEQTETIVPLKEFHAFIVRCMCAVGVSETDASSLAELLVSADYRGHYSHGLNRLGMFVYVLFV